MNNNNKQLELKNKVIKHTYKIIINNNLQENELDLNSWFKSNIYNNTYNVNNFKFKNNICKDKEYIKCKKIILTPNDEIKKILINWINDYRLMYNETIKYFNKCRFEKQDFKTDFKNIRTYILKAKKEEIMKKNKAPSHSLDYAIKDACAMMKSAISNKQNGHIKHFRLRYIKDTKNVNTFTFEKTCFSDKFYICKKTLKSPILNKSNYDYKKINCDSKLIYNKIKDEFTLLVPEKQKIIENENNKFITIDAGLRTFLTCLNNDTIIELGTNVNEYLENNIERIHKYVNLLNSNKCNKPTKIKKLINSIRLKVKHRIDDVHWKSINYLNNHKHIVIGNWSTKRCVNKKKSVLNGLTKDKLMYLNYYVFLQRLTYKCNTKKNNLIITNEAYTSKTCSRCGTSQNIGASKIYNCKECNLIIDRDINSCKNILFSCL
jgi:putative transposase